MNDSSSNTPGQWWDSRWAGWFRRILFFALLIGMWQWVVFKGVWPDYVLPGPLQVLTTLHDLFQKGDLTQAALVSMKRIAIGYSISLVIGVIAGLLIARIRMLEETLGALAMGLQTLPSVCWLPLAILWFGLSETAIIFVVVMGALFSIVQSVDAGVKGIPPQMIRAARNLGEGGLAIYVRVFLPAAMPTVLGGLKQGWAFAWRSLMAGELIFQGLSLGNLLQTGREFNDAPMVLATMMVIFAIGIIIDQAVFGPLLRRIRYRWGLEKPS